MGQLLTRFDSLVREEETEVVVEEEVVVPGTPSNIRPAAFDPRSPETEDVLRTPIIFNDGSQPQQSDVDPRSPCLGIIRTPLEVEHSNKNLDVTEDYKEEVSGRLNLDWDDSMTANDSMIAVCGSLNNISTASNDLSINESVGEDNFENIPQCEENDVENKVQEKLTPEMRTSSPLKRGNMKNSNKSPLVVMSDNINTPKSLNRNTPNKTRVVFGAIDKNSPLKLVQRKQTAKISQQLTIQPSAVPELGNHTTTAIDKEDTY